MSIPGTFDALIILLLIGYLGYGFGVGFVRSVFGLAGIVLGGVAAFFAVPLLGAWIPFPAWRIVIIIAAVIALLAVGQAVGAWVGRAIRRRLEETKLSLPDRIGGAAINVVVAALVASMVSFSVASLGVPVLSQAIAGSNVLRTIDSLTPPPVDSALAQLRSIVIQEGIPRIISAAGGEPATAPEIPDVDTGTPSLEKAARSVVKVTGNAWQCGQNQSGSGFVVAADRVVTNAHVVAGVSDPVVEIPGAGALPGKLVYFDPPIDLAVNAGPGLPAPHIPLRPTLSPGDDAVFVGYPLGGPFQSAPATVEQVETVRVNDIYGANPHEAEVYRLAANVQEGNSGGPLLSTNGRVAGVIFAKAAETANVGYALTMQELLPVAGQADSFSEPVSSGNCVRR
jgi:S1-C subfamily serine protease